MVKWAQSLYTAVDTFHVLIFSRTWLIYCSFDPVLSWTRYASKQKKNSKVGTAFKEHYWYWKHKIIDWNHKSSFKAKKQELQRLLWKTLRLWILRMISKRGRETTYFSIHVFDELQIWFGCLPRFPFLHIIYPTLSSLLRINHSFPNPNQHSHYMLFLLWNHMWWVIESCSC